MFKGFSICAHTVATAEVNGELRSFVTWTNLTSIALQEMPTGAGRKGGIAKKKKTSPIDVETYSSRFSTNGPDPKRTSLAQGKTTTGANISNPLQPAVNHLITIPTMALPGPLQTSIATGQ